MAKPIKETPFLRGKDAVKFIKDNSNVAKISDSERSRIVSNFNFLDRIAKFKRG